MRIQSINSKPLTTFRFLNAARRGNIPNTERLGVLRATCTGIPEELDAIIATADLQGLEHWDTANGHPPRLMGEVIPQLLCEHVLAELNVEAGRTGILLCGDFYTVPGATKRGGTGDVTVVWKAFGERFRWIAGVAGNHDTFGEATSAKPSFPQHMRLLDLDTAKLDKLKIAGISGTIGSPDRHLRRTEETYCEHLELLLTTDSDVVLMHDGPDSTEPRQRGSAAVRAVLDQCRPSLVIRGHTHWDTPLIQLVGGTQVLNADSRIVVLTAS